MLKMGHDGINSPLNCIEYPSRLAFWLHYLTFYDQMISYFGFWVQQKLLWSLRVPKMLFGIVKMGNFGLKQPKIFFKIVISKVKNSYSVWRAISKCANNFLGTLNGSGILHLTQTIIMTNCSFIKSQKMQLKWTKLFKNDNFEWLFILLWKWK